MRNFDVYLDVERPAYGGDVEDNWEVVDSTGRDVAVLGVIDSPKSGCVRLSLPIVASDVAIHPATWTITFGGDYAELWDCEIKEIDDSNVDALYVR